MRRNVAALLCLAVLVLLFPAGTAHAHHKRTAKEEYAGPMLWPVFGSCQMRLGCTTFYPQPGERWLKVEVLDRTGTATYAYVNQDIDGDRIDDKGGYICGESDRYRISDKHPVRVFVLLWWPLCPMGIGTMGTVNATFWSR